MKIMAEVEKLEGRIKPQINSTGPRMGKNEALNEFNLFLYWIKFLAKRTNNETFANSDGWKVKPETLIHLLALAPSIDSPPLIAQQTKSTAKPKTRIELLKKYL